jgi:hypothetical protein
MMQQNLSAEAKTANRFHLLAKDASQVIGYLQLLLDSRNSGIPDPSGIMHSAVMTASIVVYARSFSRNDNSAGYAPKRADITLLPLAKDLRLMQLHQRIIAARNTMIAHSDWDKRQSMVLERVSTDCGRFAGVLRQSTAAEGWEGIFEREFLELARQVWEQSRQYAAQLDRQVH